MSDSGDSGSPFPCKIPRVELTGDFIPPSFEQVSDMASDQLELQEEPVTLLNWHPFTQRELELIGPQDTFCVGWAMFRVVRYYEVDDVLLADNELRGWYIDTLEVSLDAGRSWDMGSAVRQIVLRRVAFSRLDTQDLRHKFAAVSPREAFMFVDNHLRLAPGSRVSLVNGGRLENLALYRRSLSLAQRSRMELLYSQRQLHFRLLSSREFPFCRLPRQWLE